MTKLFAVLIALAVPALASADPAPLFRNGTPSPNDPDLRLMTILEFLTANDRGFAAQFETVVTCVREGGRAGLAAGQDGRRRPAVSIACENGVPAHDPDVQGVTITEEQLAFYNQTYGSNVRVTGRELGFGTGVPAPGGLPSTDYFVIGPDATLAVRQIIWQRATPYYHDFEERERPCSPPRELERDPAANDATSESSSDGIRTTPQHRSLEREPQENVGRGEGRSEGRRSAPTRNDRRDGDSGNESDGGRPTDERTQQIDRKGGVH
jgi:hypothetical protein